MLLSYFPRDTRTALMWLGVCICVMSATTVYGIGSRSSVAIPLLIATSLVIWGKAIVPLKRQFQRLRFQETLQLLRRIACDLRDQGHTSVASGAGAVTSFAITPCRSRITLQHGVTRIYIITPRCVMKQTHLPHGQCVGVAPIDHQWMRLPPTRAELRLLVSALRDSLPVAN